MGKLIICKKVGRDRKNPENALYVKYSSYSRGGKIVFITSPKSYEIAPDYILVEVTKEKEKYIFGNYRGVVNKIPERIDVLEIDKEKISPELKEKLKKWFINKLKEKDVSSEIYYYEYSIFVEIEEEIDVASEILFKNEEIEEYLFEDFYKTTLYIRKSCKSIQDVLTLFDNFFDFSRTNEIVYNILLKYINNIIKEKELTLSQSLKMDIIQNKITPEITFEEIYKTIKNSGCNYEKRIVNTFLGIYSSLKFLFGNDPYRKGKLSSLPFLETDLEIKNKKIKEIEEKIDNFMEYFVFDDKTGKIVGFSSKVKRLSDVWLSSRIFVFLSTKEKFNPHIGAHTLHIKKTFEGNGYKIDIYTGNVWISDVGEAEESVMGEIVTHEVVRGTKTVMAVKFVIVSDIPLSNLPEQFYVDIVKAVEWSKKEFSDRDKYYYPVAEDFWNIRTKWKKFDITHYTSLLDIYEEMLSFMEKEYIEIEKEKKEIENNIKNAENSDTIDIEKELHEISAKKIPNKKYEEITKNSCELVVELYQTIYNIFKKYIISVKTEKDIEIIYKELNKFIDLLYEGIIDKPTLEETYFMLQEIKEEYQFDIKDNNYLYLYILYIYVLYPLVCDIVEKYI